MGLGLGGAEHLTKSNFKLYCAKHYSNPDNPDMDDLERDLKHLTYIKRLLNEYVNKGEIRDRLILNYIIILANLFGTEHCVRLLFFRIDERCWPVLKTFLNFLNFMPPRVTGLKKKVVNEDIPLDVGLYGRLQSL